MNRVTCHTPTLATTLNAGVLTSSTFLAFENIQKGNAVGLGACLASATISVLGYVKQSKTLSLIGLAILTAKFAWDSVSAPSTKKPQSHSHSDSFPKEPPLPANGSQSLDAAPLKESANKPIGTKSGQVSSSTDSQPPSSSNLEVHFVDKAEVETESNTDKCIDFREAPYKNQIENTLLNKTIRDVIIKHLNENSESTVYQRLFIFWPFSETDDSELKIVAKNAYKGLNQATSREVYFVRDYLN